MAELKRLMPWEEVIGSLQSIQDCDGFVLALIGRNSVTLPPELGEELRPYLGIRIAVLRTDISGRLYLIRVIPELKVDSISGVGNAMGVA